MWEQIQANRRKSRLVIGLMALMLALLGWGIGIFLFPNETWVGVLIGVGLWGFLWLIAETGGSGILLSSVGAREISHDDNPRLDNVVEEMRIASGLPAKPKVYIMDSNVPNAFAVGTPKKSAVAVTTGLLSRLSRDELQGVIAHEIGHISNQDTRFMTLAGVMVGAIILLSFALRRAPFFAGRGRRRSAGGGGYIVIILMLVTLILALLAPLLAQLLYFACSRRREYLADASAAQFTRYPEGLASALEKISSSASRMGNVNQVVAPMYIVNPLQRKRAAVSLFSTHPPTSERVRVLRSMAGGAAYTDYEQAFSEATGDKLIGAATLGESRPVAIRQPSAEPEPDRLGRARQAGDILHRLAGFLFLPCTCGLSIKVPPTYKDSTLNCPRCGRPHVIPAASAARPTPEARAKAEPLVYHRQAQGWEAFRCSCGGTVQLSPAFAGGFVKCPKCGQEITVEQS